MSWLFFKKEWVEFWRGRRALILLIVFAVFGILSPLMAKLTPELLKLSTDTKALRSLIPQPDSAASWTQYYKNVTQIGLFVFAILFGNTVSGELQHGTLINLVTKGLPRYAVILGKYALAVCAWGGSMLVAFAITWGYTAYYFPDNKSPHLLAGLLPLLLFGLFFAAVLLFGSTLAANSYGGLLTAVVVYGVLAAANLVERVQRFNPVTLISDNMTLTQGTEKLAHLAPAMAIAIIAAAGLVWGAVQLLNEQRL